MLALLTAYAYVRLTLAFPGPGGTVTFIGRAFGSGLLAAGLNTLLVFSYVMVMALYAIAFANYGGHFVPEASARLAAGLASGVIVVLALVNLVGPGLVERSEGLFNIVKLADPGPVHRGRSRQPEPGAGASGARALGGRRAAWSRSACWCSSATRASS